MADSDRVLEQVDGDRREQFVTEFDIMLLEKRKGRL